MPQYLDDVDFEVGFRAGVQPLSKLVIMMMCESDLHIPISRSDA